MDIKVTVVAMVCALALGLGYAGAARAQQGGGTALGHPGGATAGSGQNAGGAGAMSADTPEDDAALNLTDEQKAQIKTIRAKYQPQNEALRTQAKPFMDAARAAHQKGDTAAARTNMEKARQVMQGGQSIRTQENAEIRAILTPDQQAKWDANQKKMAERGKTGHKGWGKKGKTAPAAKS